MQGYKWIRRQSTDRRSHPIAVKRATIPEMDKTFDLCIQSLELLYYFT